MPDADRCGGLVVCDRHPAASCWRSASTGSGLMWADPVAGRHDPHRWRRTFATEVLTAGVDVHTAQRLLGHGKAGTTAGYLHLLDDDLCDAVGRVYEGAG